MTRPPHVGREGGRRGEEIAPANRRQPPRRPMGRRPGWGPPPPRDAGEARGGYLRQSGGRPRAADGGDGSGPALRLRRGPDGVLTVYLGCSPAHRLPAALRFCYCLQLDRQPPFAVTGSWPSSLQPQLEKSLPKNPKLNNPAIFILLFVKTISSIV